MSNPPEQVVTLNFCNLFLFTGPKSTAEDLLNHTFKLGYCLSGVAAVGLVLLGPKKLRQLATVAVHRIRKGSVCLVLEKPLDADAKESILSSGFCEKLESLLGLPKRSVVVTVDDGTPGWEINLEATSEKYLQALRWLLGNVFSNLVEFIEAEADNHLMILSEEHPEFFEWAVLPLIAFVAFRELLLDSKDDLQSDWWHQQLVDASVSGEREQELIQYLRDCGCSVNEHHRRLPRMGGVKRDFTLGTRLLRLRDSWTKVQSVESGDMEAARKFPRDLRPEAFVEKPQLMPDIYPISDALKTCIMYADPNKQEFITPVRDRLLEKLAETSMSAAKREAPPELTSRGQIHTYAPSRSGNISAAEAERLERLPKKRSQEAAASSATSSDPGQMKLMFPPSETVEPEPESVAERARKKMKHAPSRS